MDACVGSAFDESFQGFLPKMAHSEVPEMAGEMLTRARRRLEFGNRGFGSRGVGSRGFGSRGFGRVIRRKCGLWFVVFENELTVFVAELGKGFAVELKGVVFHIPINPCLFQSSCADNVDVKVWYVGSVEQDEFLRVAVGCGNLHWHVSGPENGQLIASGPYELWMWISFISGKAIPMVADVDVGS